MASASLGTPAEQMAALGITTMAAVPAAGTVSNQALSHWHPSPILGTGRKQLGKLGGAFVMI